MCEKEKGKLLKIYIDETQKWKHTSLYHAIIVELNRLNVRGATVYRGIEGFGDKHQIHTARILDTSSGLPVIIEVVDTGEQIDRILEAIKPMVNKGFIVVADVEFIDIH
ncbi:MAG: hypothetical protein HPY66_2362 [Firmicutes bacterium]|nr:hypothetical protein [Bacillota bacterium]MDI6705748.1 DUF190 domain-containing protein [Bacillota bacterium]